MREKSQESDAGYGRLVRKLAEELPPWLREAFRFAEEAHRGQTRKDGKTPYIVHPVRATLRLWRMGVRSPVTLTACLLHDVPEDTAVTIDAIREAFGDDVATIVQQLTRAREQSRREYTAMFRTASLAACLCKAVDRADNVGDWKGMNPDYRAKYAQEGLALLGAMFGNEKVTSSLTGDVVAVLQDLEKTCLKVLLKP